MFINHPILKIFEKDFSKIFGEANESLLSILAQNMSSQDLANHEKVQEKFLLIPSYFDIKENLPKSKQSSRNVHKLSLGDASKVIEKIIKSIKEDSFTFAIKTNWKKFKYNEQLPPQKKEKFFYDYFPTRVYEDIYDIFTKLKDIFSKESDYHFDLTEDE